MAQRSRHRLLFVWHDVRNFIGRVYEGAAEANIPFLASGLTFDALLAAIPMVLLALALVGYLLSAGAGAAQVDIAEYIHRFLPAHREDMADPFAPVVDAIGRVVNERGTLGYLGLPLFIWFSTRLFSSMRTSLNEVFDLDEQRNWAEGKAVDVAMVLVTGFLFVLNTALTQGIEVVAVTAGRFGLGFIQFFATQLLAYLLMVIMFLIVFRFLPARRIRWSTAAMAALTCSVGFELAKGLMAWYYSGFLGAGRVTTDATVGGVLVFVGWTYYMTLVFLLGGTIAQVFELRRRQAAQRAILRD